MGVDGAALNPTARALSLAGLIAVPARLVLGAIVGLSFVVRAVAATGHVTPTYFPDEYLYPAIARGFANGDGPVIRGAVVHFPALLEPLLTAPFWLTNDPALALRLTQGLHALAMSLAAIPVYLLARRLNLSTRVALGAALVAVAGPDLMYASFTLSDPVAYPLVLAGVYAGVCALDRPTRRAQLAFFAFASLATFTRIQYAALPLSFALAVLVLERGNVKRVVSRYRLSLALFGIPTLAVLAVGTGTLLGAYSGVTTVGFHPLGILRWAGADAMLLVYATGVVLLPGALVALVTPRTRAERALSVLTVVFTFALLLQAGFIADFDSQRIQERYIFPVLPLAAVLFGLALARGRNAVRASLLVAFGILLMALRTPLAGYAAAHGKDDSPTLTAVLRLEQAMSPAGGSLLVALVAVALALVGVAVLARPKQGAAVAFTFAVVAAGALSYSAHAYDARNSRYVRTNDMPADARWVDHANLQHVALVEAPGSVPPHALEALWWNTSIDRELLIGNGAQTDSFGGVERSDVAPDGKLTAGGKPLSQPLLVQTYGSRLAFANARLAARGMALDLFEPTGPARVTMVANGYYFDGWLSRRGAIIVFPDATGRTSGTLRFTLSLPKGATVTPMDFSAPGLARTFTVRPGRSTAVTLPVSRKGPWTVRYSTTGGGLASDNRPISVLTSGPVFTRTNGVVVELAATRRSP